MNKGILILIVIGFMASCSNENNDNIENKEMIGEWELIEILLDPGDGSGTFQTVESDKILKFFEDGSVTSNSSLCNMSSNTGSENSGTYSTDEQIINADSCAGTSTEIRYNLENSHLILSYFCIEPCQEKYAKIE